MSGALMSGALMSGAQALKEFKVSWLAIRLD
jgi:hypothetical protein